MTPSYHPTRPPTLIYLDDDPETVASWYFDRHLLTYAGYACQLLSSVWHKEALVAQVRGPDALPDWKYVSDVGARLFGVQVFPEMSTWPANPEHLDWVNALGGNYDWTRRLGHALLDEHLYRFPKLDTQSRLTLNQLRAMLVQFEVMPTRLRATQWEFYEAPYNLAETFIQTGFERSAIDAFRHFYALGLRGIQGWTNRPRPEFITQLLEKHNLLNILP